MTGISVHVDWTRVQPCTGPFESVGARDRAGATRMDMLDGREREREIAPRVTTKGCEIGYQGGCGMTAGGRGRGMAGTRAHGAGRGYIGAVLHTPGVQLAGMLGQTDGTSGGNGGFHLLCRGTPEHRKHT